ncbi:3'(2'),5'-bisphosphate nucleotidase CysQ [Synoicihabitans lomoniglobus]|uniref:3'(2'),5'-bisphosphate nucleotidase CysQ n=1 Tax=Synoicihabitans lomoniglobus TaxID=2909285 RepID=A0AAF0CQR3_9BACT|nr:3'(2'),5'-bisphosphate nucleotidase CysQ [Opitutaceae bacterium LMO-M01]WED66335.1 3'(2'),5'-bisphosphate nucleotidase CysQ [Opitutaceae bacterium LMO-M01]
MLSILREIAEAAGLETLKFYGQPLTVDAKADNSPLTQADLASHRLITSRLRATFPDIPVVSEEDQERDDAIAKASRFFLVDPVDGTKEFIKQTGSFTVNIGLIESGKPVAGIVHVPVSGVTYGADHDGGAWRAERDSAPVAIQCVPARKTLRIVASRDHAGPEVKALLARFPNAECLSIGSSLKFCLVAEGAADIYLRDVPTMEWDTAAAQAIVEFAGGAVLNHPSQAPLMYGKLEYRNGSLLTIGDTVLLGRLHN